MSRTDDSPDVGRYGAAEVFVYDSRTGSGQAARMLMDLLPGVARFIKLRHVAGMVAGPPPEAIAGGLPMLITYDPDTRRYSSLHGVDAARAVLDRAKDLVCASGGRASRSARAEDTIVTTEADANRIIARSRATLQRESNDIANGYLWALTGSEYESTPAEIKARQQARLAARRERAEKARSMPFDESKYQISL